MENFITKELKELQSFYGKRLVIPTANQAQWDKHGTWSRLNPAK